MRRSSFFKHRLLFFIRGQNKNSMIPQREVFSMVTRKVSSQFKVKKFRARPNDLFYLRGSKNSFNRRKNRHSFSLARESCGRIRIKIEGRLRLRAFGISRNSILFETRKSKNIFARQLGNFLNLILTLQMIVAYFHTTN